MKITWLKTGGTGILVIKWQRIDWITLMFLCFVEDRAFNQWNCYLAQEISKCSILKEKLGSSCLQSNGEYRNELKDLLGKTNENVRKIFLRRTLMVLWVTERSLIRRLVWVWTTDLISYFVKSPNRWDYTKRSTASLNWRKQEKAGQTKRRMLELILQGRMRELFGCEHDLSFKKKKGGAPWEFRGIRLPLPLQAWGTRLVPPLFQNVGPPLWFLQVGLLLPSASGVGLPLQRAAWVGPSRKSEYWILTENNSFYHHLQSPKSHLNII